LASPYAGERGDSERAVRRLHGGDLVPGRDDPDSCRASCLYRRFHLPQVFARASWQASYQRVQSRASSKTARRHQSQPAASNYSRYAGDIDTLNVQATAN
jgi:hypothetical protein